MIRATQTQLHPISRPGHTRFYLIYCQLMGSMWQELSVNTRTAENRLSTKTGSLATATEAFINDLVPVHSPIWKM